MPDSRYHSSHLEFPRRDQFRLHRDEALRSCGTQTAVLTQRAPVTPMGTIVMMDPAAADRRDAGFQIVAGSLTHHLKLGYNTVGRQMDNDLVIADERLHVSRRHCSIVVHANGHAEIFDLASLNGTFVNGQRVDGSAPLRSNDVVRLGGHLSFYVILYNPIGN